MNFVQLVFEILTTGSICLVLMLVIFRKTKMDIKTPIIPAFLNTTCHYRKLPTWYFIGCTTICKSVQVDLDAHSQPPAQLRLKHYLDPKAKSKQKTEAFNSKFLFISCYNMSK